ncbi:GNAT family N-acetyltransferase [Mesorhizobium amorphae]|uniref:GNAT family N-acetyltransferase n=1 Tax=Mesorhizobium amorphae TaxID=71433 RepID=UPI0011827D89|nr:GNAT family N-acetyltransferase [Mesorhizobium amorphae]
MKITVLRSNEATTHLEPLAEILRQSVEDGALVGFVWPLSMERATAYWEDTIQSVASGERLLLGAFVDDRLVGTVQLYLSPEPNAPHRAEVYKLLVHRDFQRRGVGALLMMEVERQARQHQRSLLLLDTVEGGASERLYRRLHWQEIGKVPHHFNDPYGVPKASVYMMKHLDLTADAIAPQAEDQTAEVSAAG